MTAAEGFYEDDESPETIKAAWDRATAASVTGPPAEHFEGMRGEVAGHDAVNHPAHYTSHPSGVECIEITEHLNFCVGNAIKYLWRAGLKGESIEDLRKAAFYVDREITRVGGLS